LGYEKISNRLQRLIEYLGDHEKESPIDEGKIIEDLKGSLSEEEIKESLLNGVNLGFINEKYILICEECGEDLREIKTLEEILGKEETCEYCGKIFTVTEDDILRRYSLTYRGMDAYSRLSKKVHPFIPKFKLFPYLTDLWYQKFGGEVLKDYFIIILLHFLRDLIPFVEALEKFGAKPDKCYLICKPYPYAYKDQISFYLRNKGYNVKIAESFTEMPTLISAVLEEIQQKIKKEKLIIIEDGGYVVPILHEKFEKLLPFCRGAVEQTTKGIRKDKKVKNKKFPILDVAECDFKKEYEPQFVASAVVHNIRNMLPDTNFVGQCALVIGGGGSIGYAISSQLSDSLKMKVYVAEKNPRALLRVQSDPKIARAFKPEDVKNYIGECMLIIGVTGAQSIGKVEISSLRHGAILVSASSDRDEIDIKELELLAGDKKNMEDFLSRDGQKIGTLYILERLDSRHILLLADGYPVNFYYSESVPNESFDPILTILFRSVLELAIKPKIPPGIRLKIVNDLVLKEKIVEETLRFYRGIM
jgi:S-adenosylhomocysteine hydrolase